MSSIFKAHLEKFVHVTDQEFNAILKYFDSRSLDKRENLLEEGQICRYQYFVLQGLLRQFFIKDTGVEQTTEFAIETWWMTDNIAFEQQSPASFFVQAIEKSEVLCISQKSRETLFQDFPVMERYFRFVYQRAYAASQMRIKYYHSLSKEAFYFKMVGMYPEFVQRVPQYLIASYLGFTPEYLSEIRKKHIS